MTIEEFSNEFDVLLNSYAANNPFGIGQGLTQLDEYEKSVLLTEAQESIVRDLYNGKLTGDGFESTEEQRRNLDSLVNTLELTSKNISKPKMSNYSEFFQLPSDVWFITYESVLLSDKSLGCKNNTIADVIPVRQDEYHNIKNNPFRGPSDKRVLRIDTGSSVIELISKYTIQSYFIKYLSKPKPIILQDITDENLSINGETKRMGCELNTVLHRTILERAVALAIKRLPSKNV
nr:MAG TPA: hypothetical protein [Bacteriophage sp.]